MSSLACARDDTHVVSIGGTGTGGTHSETPDPNVCPADPRPPELEWLLCRLVRVVMDDDGAGAVIDFENDEWLPLRIERPAGEGECSWLDAPPLLVSSGLGELLSAVTVSRLIDEFPVAAELGVSTAPLDSVSIDEMEAPRERLAACSGAACGGAAGSVRVGEGRPRWLDRRACCCCLFTIANQSQLGTASEILISPLAELISSVIRSYT